MAQVIRYQQVRDNAIVDIAYHIGEILVSNVKIIFD